MINPTEHVQWCAKVVHQTCKNTVELNQIWLHISIFWGCFLNFNLNFKIKVSWLLPGSLEWMELWNLHFAGVCRWSSCSQVCIPFRYCIQVQYFWTKVKLFFLWDWKRLLLPFLLMKYLQYASISKASSSRHLYPISKYWFEQNVSI